MNIPKNEKIHFVVRKHWFVLVAYTLTIVFISIALIGAIILGTNILLTGGSLGLSVFLISAVLWIAWSMFYINWLNYYLDVLILTDKRVFDIEQHSLFSRDVADLRLDRIQDITVEVRGIIPTFLNFGNLRVQTAGSNREFIFRSVAIPYDVRDKIATALDESRKL